MFATALLAAYFGGLLSVLTYVARRDTAPARARRRAERAARHRADLARHRAARPAARRLLVATTATLLAVLAGLVTGRPAMAADATHATVPASWVRPGVIEPPVVHVDRLAPTYAERVEGTPWLLVEFNDGRLVVLRPCQYEDGRRCWWDAGTSGNGIGRSFVRFAGQMFRLPARTDVAG